MPSTPQRKTLVDKELDVLFAKLGSHEPDSEEYTVIFDRIAKLHKLQMEEKPQRISPDTLVIAGTNLLGIVMILSHERLNVITTKAMSFVLKPR